MITTKEITITPRQGDRLSSEVKLAAFTSFHTHRFFYDAHFGLTGVSRRLIDTVFCSASRLSRSRRENSDWEYYGIFAPGIAPKKLLGFAALHDSGLGDQKVPTIEVLAAGSKQQKGRLATLAALGLADYVFATHRRQVGAIASTMQTPETAALGKIGFVNRGSQMLGALGCRQTFGMRDFEGPAQYEWWSLDSEPAHATDAEGGLLAGLQAQLALKQYLERRSAVDVTLPFGMTNPIFRQAEATAL